MDGSQEVAPVPNSVIVIRLWYSNRIVNSSSRGTGSGALAGAFSLSTEDKKHNPPYLSVFDESLTTKEQAQLLTGGNKDLLLRLSVSEVRDLVNPSFPEHKLDVC